MREKTKEKWGKNGGKMGGKMGEKWMDGKTGTSKTVRSSLTCNTHSQTKEHFQKHTFKSTLSKAHFQKHTFKSTLSKAHDHPSSIPTFRQYPTIRTTFQGFTFEMAVLHQGDESCAWVGITTTIGRFPPPHHVLPC
jgi:hypothetical protein